MPAGIVALENAPFVEFPDKFIDTIRAVAVIITMYFKYKITECPECEFEVCADCLVDTGDGLLCIDCINFELNDEF